MDKYCDTQALELTQEFFLQLLRSPDTVKKDFESSAASIDFTYLKELSARHNILPTVAKIISRLPDNFIPAVQKEAFQAESRALVMRSLQMAREYTRISELLTAAEIPHLPYKGPALAELYYSDPPLRTCSDLDILVPKEKSITAITLLAENGFLPAFGLDRHRWSGLPEVTNHFMMLHPTLGWGVEIHWQLFKDWQQVPFDLSAYWRKNSLAQGASATQLSDEDLLVICCAHALKHSWSTLKWVMDLDRIIRSRPNLDWQKVVACATALGLLRGLGTGLLLADQYFATPLPDFLSKQLNADKRLEELVYDVGTQWLSPGAATVSYAWKVRFFLRSRERSLDNVLMCFRYLFSPTLEDYLAWDFGRRVSLYRLLRPIAVIARVLRCMPKLPCIKK